MPNKHYSVRNISFGLVCAWIVVLWCVTPCSVVSGNVVHMTPCGVVGGNVLHMTLCSVVGDDMLHMTLCSVVGGDMLHDTVQCCRW